MGRIVHFEIHAAQPENAIPFYEQLFRWTFTKWPGPVDYWLISTGAEGDPGFNGGLVRRQGPGPAGGEPINAYVCMVQVEDVDTTAARAAELGGALAVEKSAIPGVGWLAYLQDPEGNILGITMRDPDAA